MIALTTSLSAQDLVSKKGEVFLPESGDWAISADATPFLDYVGRLLSNAGANSPTMGYTNGYPWAIRGKMFKDENTAYRAGIRLGFGNTKWMNEIPVPQASGTPAVEYPNLSPVANDEFKRSYSGVVLSGGLEMRRGNTRLQGYYGGELIIGMMGEKDAYTYANALSSGSGSDPEITAGANSTDWSTSTGYNNLGDDPAGGDGRMLERKESSMMIGARGFIGVEYFIFPKISVGAEYGWGLGFGSTKVTDTSEGSETVDGSLVIGNFTNETKVSGFSVDSDIQNNMTGMVGGSGSLNIIFHF